MKQAAAANSYRILVKMMGVILMLVLLPATSFSKEQIRIDEEAFFTLENGINLREMGGKQVQRRLTRVRGKGEDFGEKQRESYCGLKENSTQVQWVLNDLETGEIISRSANADKMFFGASVSKVFVAAALLDKQEGVLSKTQLNHMVKLIVISNNPVWKDLQRQVGDDGTDDSGRAAVHEFVQRMGYTNTKGFQGWMKKRNGKKVHGNELNALELSKFLYDTHQRNYTGAEVLWKIMHATKTGGNKIDKYTPSSFYIGGKTGTYSGPNESPATIKHKTIGARNHAAILAINGKYYGLSILTNRGRSEDVAILGGGLIREYLGVEQEIACF